MQKQEKTELKHVKLPVAHLKKKRKKEPKGGVGRNQGHYHWKTRRQSEKVMYKLWKTEETA